MGTGNGYDTSPPSWHANSAAMMQVGIEIGLLRAAITQQTAALTQQAAVLRSNQEALNVLLAAVNLLLTRSTNSSPISKRETAPAESGSKRSVERIAGRVLPDILIFLGSRLWAWALPYLVPGLLAIWALVKVVWRWIEYAIPAFG